MVKIKTCKQTCSHSVTFPSVDTGKQRGGRGPYCAHTPSCTHAWHAWRWRDNDRAKAGAHENGCFRVFLRNLIRVCEVSNSFFSLKKLWEDLNLLRHHQSFHFSFAVTLQTLACYVYPAVYRFFECHLLCFYTFILFKFDSWNIGIRQSMRQVVCPPSALLISGRVWKHKSPLQKRAASVQVTQNCTALFVKF